MNSRTCSRRFGIGGMISEMRDALEAVLGPISEPLLLPGGASKEAWSVDAGGERLLVRRAGGGVIHRHTLSLRHEFEVLQAAYEAGVRVPRPVAYIADLEGGGGGRGRSGTSGTGGGGGVSSWGGGRARRSGAASSAGRCPSSCRCRWRTSSRRSMPFRRSGCRSPRRAP